MGFGQLRQNGIIGFGKAARDGPGQFDQTLAVGREFVARGNFFLFIRRQIGARDFTHLMPQQIDFLFARRFGGAERRVLSPQGLERAKSFPEFPQQFFGVGESVEQRELFVG